MNKMNLVGVPHEHAHVHFYDYIESFPNLKIEESFEVQQNKIMDKLRHQFLYQNDYEESLLLFICYYIFDNFFIFIQKCV